MSIFLLDNMIAISCLFTISKDTTVIMDYQVVVTCRCVTIKNPDGKTVRVNNVSRCVSYTFFLRISHGTVLLFIMKASVSAGMMSLMLLPMTS